MRSVLLIRGKMRITPMQKLNIYNSQNAGGLYKSCSTNISPVQFFFGANGEIADGKTPEEEAWDNAVILAKEKQKALKAQAAEEAIKAAQIKRKKEAEIKPKTDELITKINGVKTIFRRKPRYNATRGEDGLIEIEVLQAPSKAFHLDHVFGEDIDKINEAFKYIGRIKGSLFASCLKGRVNLGALKEVTGTIYYDLDECPRGLDNVKADYKHGHWSAKIVGY